jgi:glucan 1,3-beta-glucosidase
MAILSTASLFVILRVLLVALWPAALVDAIPAPQTNTPSAASSNYWLASIPRNGKVAYGNTDPNFKIYRNVKDFGAKGRQFLDGFRFGRTDKIGR